MREADDEPVFLDNAPSASVSPFLYATERLASVVLDMPDVELREDLVAGDVTARREEADVLDPMWLPPSLLDA